MEVGQYKIGAIIQARLGSTRLPNKVLMPMPIGSNHTIISRVVNSLKDVHEISKIIVVTSKLEINNKLEKYVTNLDVDCYRGEEEDVLSRFYEVVRNENFDFVLRFTADNPIVDVTFLKSFIFNFINKNLDYSYSEKLPLGCNFEMMKSNQIVKAYLETNSKYDKEHVTPFIKKNSKKNEPYFFKEVDHKNEIRLTVDFPSDYAFLNLIFLLLENKDICIKNILNILEENKWLIKINKGNYQIKNFATLKDEIDEILPIVREREMYRIETVLINEKENTL